MCRQARLTSASAAASSKRNSVHASQLAVMRALCVLHDTFARPGRIPDCAGPGLAALQQLLVGSSGQGVATQRSAGDSRQHRDIRRAKERIRMRPPPSEKQCFQSRPGAFPPAQLCDCSTVLFPETKAQARQRSRSKAREMQVLCSLASTFKPIRNMWQSREASEVSRKQCAPPFVEGLSPVCTWKARKFCRLGPTPGSRTWPDLSILASGLEGPLRFHHLSSLGVARYACLTWHGAQDSRSHAEQGCKSLKKAMVKDAASLLRPQEPRALPLPFVPSANLDRCAEVATG